MATDREAALKAAREWLSVHNVALPGNFEALANLILHRERAARIAALRWALQYSDREVLWIEDNCWSGRSRIEAEIERLEREAGDA